VGPKFSFKLYDDWKIGADGLALPLIGKCHNFALQPLNVKRFIAVLGVMVNHHRDFNTNTIANFHNFLATTITTCAFRTTQRFYKPWFYDLNYLCT
jgi:hypothetical protein